MPNYEFVCNNELCPNDDISIISMKMAEYTDKHYCTTCGDKMNRSARSLVCGYTSDKDFYGKKSS